MNSACDSAFQSSSYPHVPSLPGLEQARRTLWCLWQALDAGKVDAQDAPGSLEVPDLVFPAISEMAIFGGCPSLVAKGLICFMKGANMIFHDVLERYI